MNIIHIHSLSGYVATLATALAFFAGCTGYSEQVEPQREEHRAPLTITATIGQPSGASASEAPGATKTYLNTGETDNMTAYWKAGDQIGLTALPASGNVIVNKPFTLSDGASSKRGSFTEIDQSPATTWPTGTSADYVAVYPYQSGATVSGSGDARVLNLTYPRTQRVMTGTNGNFSSGVMVARSADLTGIPTELAFENLFTILKFTVNCSSSKVLKRVIFTDRSNAPVSGMYQLNLNTKAIAFTSTDLNDRYLVLDLGEGLTLTGTGQPLYMAVPSRTYSAGFNVTFIDANGGTMTKSKTSSTTLDAGKYYTMEEVPYAAATPTNLSMREGLPVTANCYIVSTVGQYSFWADVIGNGDPGLLLEESLSPLQPLNHRFHTTSSAISPASAALLWQDVPDLITNVAYSGGKVTFTASAGKGNAVIAVYDNADPAATGARILWSWHIWCTDAPENDTYTNRASRTFTVMDRNLGATSKTPATVSAKGLLYQWGRKDPFPSSSSIDDNNEPTLYNAAGTGSTSLITLRDNSSSVGTIAYSIQHPTSFIKGVAASSFDWYWGGGAGPAQRNNYLWGNPTGYNYAGTIPPTPQKSIYDPCPPGYKVAPLDTWTGFTTSGGNTTSTINFCVIGDWDYGWNFECNGSDAVGTWYPASGYRYYGSGSFDEVGANGYYWSSSPGSNGSERAGSLYFHQSYTFTSTSYTYPLSSRDRASGCSVRCTTN